MQVNAERALEELVMVQGVLHKGLYDHVLAANAEPDIDLIVGRGSRDIGEVRVTAALMSPVHSAVPLPVGGQAVLVLGGQGPGDARRSGQAIALHA